MQNSAKFSLQVITVTLLGVAVGWGVSRLAKGQERTIETGDGKYEFDGSMDSSLPAEMLLTEGQKLALVVGISKGSPVPQYLGILQKKYQGQGLKTLVVLPPDSPKGLILLTAAVEVPSVVDSDGRFQHQLRFVSTHRHDAILVYDQNYRVKFHFLGMPDNDVLRQLVEKYLVGRITYKPSELLASSLIGRHVEGLQCSADPAPSRGIFVVFPPGCSSCELNSYKKSLEKARRTAWGSSGPDGRWILVFVNGRDARAVAHAGELGFRDSEVCGVREDILLDPYQTRKSPATAPLLLLTDEKGVVTEVRDLIAISGGDSK